MAHASTSTASGRDLTSGRVVQLMRPFLWRLLVVVGLLAALAITNMALPYMVKLLIDDAFPRDDGASGNWGLLWFILPGLGFVYVVRNSLFFSSRMMAVRVGEDLCFTLRKRLFEQMQQMSLRFYKTHQAGKVGSRVMDDTFKIQSFIQDKLPTFLLNVLMFQTLLVILYAVNWRLALASTLVLPMHFITYFYFRQPIKRSHTEAQENISAAYGNLVEKFLGIEVVKGFTAEDRESDSFREAIDASRRSQIRTQRFQFVQKVVADLFIGLATIGLLGFGAMEVKNGRMQAGEFIMFYAYVGMLYPSVLEIITGASHMSKTTACVDRVFEMFDQPLQDETPRLVVATVHELEQIAGAIDFRKVSFQYDPSTPVLHDLNLSIRAGEHVAITGPSGSGKSTMMKLLARFVETTEGEIRMDNVPIDTLNIGRLRGALSFAFQEVYLFNTSIFENLRYARPDVTLEEVIEVCQLTGAHDVIRRLPNGYATRVGEYGGELSRGEKQRITLARALIKDPRILVLDEATASIDAISARTVIESIFWLMEGRTVIMVTHDIALLDLADRVIAIADGRVVFDGTPAAYLDGEEPPDRDAAAGDDGGESGPFRFSPGAAAPPGFGPAAGRGSESNGPAGAAAGAAAERRRRRESGQSEPERDSGAADEADARDAGSRLPEARETSPPARSNADDRPEAKVTPPPIEDDDQDSDQGGNSGGLPVVTRRPATRSAPTAVGVDRPAGTVGPADAQDDAAPRVVRAGAPLVRRRAGAQGYRRLSRAELRDRHRWHRMSTLARAEPPGSAMTEPPSASADISHAAVERAMVGAGRALTPCSDGPEGSTRSGIPAVARSRWAPDRLLLRLGMAFRDLMYGTSTDSSSATEQPTGIFGFAWRRRHAEMPDRRTLACAVAALRPLMVVAGVAGFAVLGSCVSSERHTGRSVELVEPKTSAGVLAQADPEAGLGLDQLAEALDRFETEESGPYRTTSEQGGSAFMRSGPAGPDEREVEWERLLASGDNAMRRQPGGRVEQYDQSHGDQSGALTDATAESTESAPLPRQDLSWLAGSDEWPSLMAWDAELGTQPQPPALSDDSAAQEAPHGDEAPSPSPDAAPLENGDTKSPTAALDQTPAQPSPPVARVFPPDAGRLVDLPKLGSSEIAEIIDRLSLTLETEQGYAAAPGSVERQLPSVPDGVVLQRTLARDDGDNAVRVVRLGYRRYVSQPPQLWAWAIVLPSQPNESRQIVATTNVELLDGVGGQITTILDGINAMRSAIVPAELDKRLIQLSYIDPTAAITMLRGLGITALSDAAGVPNPVPFNQLPLVIQTPAPTKEQIGLVGTTGSARGEFGQSTTPTEAVQLPDIVNMSPTSQLMVLYHPAFPEQFSQIRALIDDMVDRPARQIFVEGLVLEISETGLQDLGIEWQFKEGPFNWIAGTLDPGGVADTLVFDYVDGRDFARDWSTQIRALIRDGKAEILSRPSVLTLNNRQATIRVGQDIPIATSQEGFSNYSNKVAFTFKYLATGILLNVRPRIVEDGSEVGMLVDAVVSNVVPGADLEIRSDEGDLLASAPTVSTRRVQTYARIRNNTPFIIGGLVSRDYSTIQDKVPILGDLPLVGVAFRAERTQTIKREVIIVLTPYVLPDDQNIARSLPKDEDVFDSFGNILFRDAYRIRSGDVYDLAFLLKNRRLLAYQDIALALIRNNFQLAAMDPFSEFVGGRVPGEDVLVHRMIYEVIKRLEAAEVIDPERLIFFEDAEGVAGYNVSFLSRVLTRLGGGDDYTSFFENNKGKALALIYHNDRETMVAARMSREPVPEFALVDCPDESTWQRLLWELNQPSADGRERCTILIRNESDLTRLRRAIMLKKVIQLNGGAQEVGLENFRVGKLILMPEVKPGQAHVIDVDVARLFYHTELYYAATLERIEDACRALDALVQNPDIRALLNGMFIPTPVEDVEDSPVFIEREDVVGLP